MKKKLTAFLSAALFMCSLLPLSAAAKGNTFGVNIDAACAVPEVTIKVVVPSTETVILNPKGLPVSVSSSGSISEGQIVTVDGSYVENQSEVPLSVTVSVTGAIKEGSDMSLVSSSTKDSGSRAKRAFVYFEMHAVSDPSNVTWDSEYNDEQHIPVRAATTKTKKNLLILSAGNKDNGVKYGAFRLTGDCVENPKQAWTGEDGFTATIAFTFKGLPLTEDPSN